MAWLRASEAALFFGSRKAKQMAHVLFERLGVVVALGMIFAAGGGVVANASLAESVNASKAQAYDGDCARPVKHAHSALLERARHHRKFVARHKPVGSPQAVAERRVATAVVVASNAAPSFAPVSVAHFSCSGANAWSMMCPGSQLIGISY